MAQISKFMKIEKKENAKIDLDIYNFKVHLLVNSYWSSYSKYLVILQPEVEGKIKQKKLKGDMA